MQDVFWTSHIGIQSSEYFSKGGFHPTSWREKEGLMTIIKPPQ